MSRISSPDQFLQPRLLTTLFFTGRQSELCLQKGAITDSRLCTSFDWRALCCAAVQLVPQTGSAQRRRKSRDVFLKFVQKQSRLADPKQPASVIMPQLPPPPPPPPPGWCLVVWWGCWGGGVGGFVGVVWVCVGVGVGAPPTPPPPPPPPPPAPPPPPPPSPPHPPSTFLLCFGWCCGVVWVLVVFWFCVVFPPRPPPPPSPLATVPPSSPTPPPPPPHPHTGRFKRRSRSPIELVMSGPGESMTLSGLKVPISTSAIDKTAKRNPRNLKFFK